MLAAFTKYKESQQQIAEFFGLECVWHNIIDCLDGCWTEYDDSVSWTEDEDEYSFEIYGSSRWEKDGFVLFVGDNSCGDRDMFLFSTAKQIKDEEE